MTKLYILNTLEIFTLLSRPVESDASWISIAIALAIGIGGPWFGMYKYISNADKILNATGNAFGKLSKMAYSKARGVADRRGKERYERSWLGQLNRDRKSIKDTDARKRQIERYGRSDGLGSVWRGAATLGIGKGSEGRQKVQRTFAADIDAAKQSQRDSEIKSISNNVGAQAAEYALQGAYYDNKANVWRYGAGTLDKSGRSRLGQEIQRSDIDESTAAGLEYLRRNNLAANGRDSSGKITSRMDSNAIRSAIDQTTKTGKYNSDLASGAFDITSDEDKAAIVDYGNTSAATAGLKHLQYNTVDKDPSTGQLSLNFGGQKGASGMKGVTDSRIDGGIKGISKYELRDKKAQPYFKQSLDDLYSKNQTKFWSELASADQDQLDAIMQMYYSRGAVGRIGGSGKGNTLMTKTDFMANIRKAMPKQNA